MAGENRFCFLLGVSCSPRVLDRGSLFHVVFRTTLRDSQERGGRRTRWELGNQEHWQPSPSDTALSFKRAANSKGKKKEVFLAVVWEVKEFLLGEGKLEMGR